MSGIELANEAVKVLRENGINAERLGIGVQVSNDGLRQLIDAVNLARELELDRSAAEMDEAIHAGNFKLAHMREG